MSYRDDLKAFKAQRNERQLLVSKIIKINIIALAAALFLTAVLMVVDFATGSAAISGSNSNSGSSDRRAPVITLADGADVIYLYAGETVSWRSKVNITDDEGSFELKVDSSNVNTDVKGTYTVIYTATDASGNTTQFTATVVVTAPEYSIATLYEVIGTKAAALGITKDMSTQDKIFAIYDYVNSSSTVKFVNESNIPAINRANWETDWIEEALRTLDTNEGDCYSYYSLSKAFFEYFGIENKGIVRDKASNESGTHFWSMVNIGTSTSPLWYFYDATRLKGSFGDGTKNACLITLDKLKSYVTSDGGTQFYMFNESAYPKSATAQISR